MIAELRALLYRCADVVGDTEIQADIERLLRLPVVSHVPAQHPLTETMRAWCAEAGLEWQDPHFVFTKERDDIASEASWEWWRGDRYLSAAIYGDESPPDIVLYPDRGTSIAGEYERPLDRDGFLDLWRRFVA